MMIRLVGFNVILCLHIWDDDFNWLTAWKHQPLIKLLKQKNTHILVYLVQFKFKVAIDHIDLPVVFEHVECSILHQMMITTD